MTDKPTALARIVGVEEHFALPSLVPRITEAAATDRGYLSRDQPFGPASLLDKLADTDDRLKVLDAAGQTVQVLSLAGPGADLLPPREAVRWAREANDLLADKVAAHPTRYAGFAHLPTTDPDASADELERTVRDLGFKGALIQGATEGRYLDHPSYEPLLARAETLDVPIYVHPAPSPKPARDALYGGLPGELGFWMSISGWGWHADTATHMLRLLLSGALQRHPGLKLIIGHLGEGLQILLPRLDQQFTGLRASRECRAKFCAGRSGSASVAFSCCPRSWRRWKRSGWTGSFTRSITPSDRRNAVGPFWSRCRWNLKIWPRSRTIMPTGC